MLKSRLYELELMKQQDSANTGEKSEIGWGIKSVLMCFSLISKSKTIAAEKLFLKWIISLMGISKMIEGVLIALKAE